MKLKHLLEIIAYSITTVVVYWLLYDLLLYYTSDFRPEERVTTILMKIRPLFFLLALETVDQLYTKRSYFKRFIRSLIWVYLTTFSLIVWMEYCDPGYTFSLPLRVIVSAILIVLAVINLIKWFKTDLSSKVIIAVSAMLAVLDLTVTLVVFFAIYDLLW